MTVAGSVRTIKTVFSGDAKGLVDAGTQGSKAVSGWKTGIDNAAKGIAGAVAGIAAGLAKIGGDFDSAYDTIRSTTGKTGAEFIALQKDFKAAVVDIPASFEEVSTALAQISQRTGATGKDLQSLTKTVVELGKVSGEDVPTLISATTRVFGDWSVATKDQTKFLDELWRTAQITGITVGGLSDLVVQFGAPLRQLGFSFEDSIALLGKWEKEGVNTELVLGGLKKTLGAAAKAGQDPVKALAKLEASIKSAGTTAKANAIAVEALGVKAGPDFAAAIREGRLEMSDLVNQIKNGSETIQGTADDTADFAEQLQELKNRAFVALEPAAAAVFEKLNEGADSLKEFGDWAEKNKETVKTLTVVLGGFAAAIVAISIIMKVYAAVTAAVTAVQWLLNVAMTANPIGLIIAAIALLVAGFLLLWNNSEGFRKFWIGLWEENVKAVKAAVDFITGPVWEGIKWVFNKITTELGKAKDLVGGFFTSVGSAILGAFDAAGQNIKKTINVAVGLVNKGINAVNKLVDGVNKIPGVNIPHVPNIPALARGGNMVRGRTYLLGERGPEIYTAGMSGRLHSTADSFGSDGGIIDLKIPIYIGDEVVRTVDARIDLSDRAKRRRTLAGSGAMA